MSIDMSQFYQVFFEESAEHLASMESLLLALDLDAPDPDQLNAIFRSAHSIKGGSGTFGFNDMTEVTHILETLLDGIRKNEITITADMVDAFLQAGDVLHGLLEAHQNGTIADPAASLEICARLEQLTAEGSPGQQTKSGQASVAAPGATAETPPSSVQHTYQIKFAKSSAIFPKKTDLNNLLEDLSNIGRIENQEVAAKSVTLSLTTYVSETELHDIFAFFLESEQLTITLLGDSAPGSNAGSEDDAGYGFFVEPEQIRATSEDAQGYGFFIEPEALKSEAENAQGYGFFVEPEAVKSEVENAQGYGFFVDVENQTQPPAAAAAATQQDELPHRRATDRAPAAAAAETSIRVSVEKVDQMINLVGELVITQSMLAEIASHLDAVLHEKLINGLALLERNSRELQESVMSVRMMPINFVFSRFPRLVRDLAGKLDKKVQLKMVGEGTELDKGLIEKISDPLTHLVRNSLDHGIEMPDERIARGKDPQGTITLRAAHQGGNIVIQVVDDGAGLNRELILAKAREKGLPVSDSMSDADVWQMIFSPGFSTAAMVTDVSGRGVGMDVVKRNIEGIGGRVEIASKAGEGSTITIRLPLTLAILDGLSIAVGDQIYIVPLNFIIESLQPNAADIKEISGQGQVIHVRGEYLPVIALHQVFNITPKFTNPAEGILVLLEAEGKKVALFVDDLVGQHQVVIKSLETNYRKVVGVSGATIMGDGRVAMIMDVGALVKFVQQ
ncbi:MAG TPA: chemotaxis protein CheA [Gallionella sp.]|nr:chemotaxis protein CheA [Gallionella sp.]